jgi:hypothetical protein
MIYEDQFEYDIEQRTRGSTRIAMIYGKQVRQSRGFADTNVSRTVMRVMTD